MWVVGDAGLVLHYDGATWTAQSVPTSVGLRSAFAVSASDVWACGEAGVLLHYDGESWSLVMSGTSSALHSVWAAGAAHVYVAGDAGTLLFCDGPGACAAVAVPTTAALYAVAGSREQDVFAVGEGGVAWEAMLETHDERIPYSLLQEPPADDLYRNHVNSLRAEHRRAE